MNKIILVFITSLLFYACSKSEPVIRIGMNQWPGYEPIYAAKIKGLYKKHGLNVEILEFGSLNDVKTAYVRGQIDIMCSTLIELIKSYDESGIASKVLMPTDFSNGPDVIIAKEVTKIKDLKGKRIGVEKGTLGMYMLARSLQKANMSFSDVEIVPLDQSSMVEGFIHGKIDASITYPPTSVNILKKVSDAKIVFSSRDIPYEVIDVLVVKSSFLNNNKNLALKINKVWSDALNLLKTNKAEMISIMAKREKISSAEFIEIMDGLVYLTKEDQKKLYEKDHKLKKALETTIRVLYESKDLSKLIDAETFL